MSHGLGVSSVWRSGNKITDFYWRKWPQVIKIPPKRFSNMSFPFLLRAFLPIPLSNPTFVVGGLYFFLFLYGQQENESKPISRFYLFSKHGAINSITIYILISGARLNSLSHTHKDGIHAHTNTHTHICACVHTYSYTHSYIWN